MNILRPITDSLYFLCFLFTTSCIAVEPIHPKQNDSFYIGIFYQFKVTDGDTFSVEGLAKSIRFLGIDTEESPKGKNASLEVNNLSKSWPTIYWKKRGENRFPAKMNSPFGYQTALWAKEWFSDVDSVRLERDVPNNVYGYYGRYLAYVIAYKNGKEYNYNIECVRQGYSPYSGKYGFSKRFHDDFMVAQNEARLSKRGIWNPVSLCYPDYDERLHWWNARGKAISEYDSLFYNKPLYFFLGRDGELERLKLTLNKTVVIFGTIGEINSHKFPRLVEVDHKKNCPAYIVFSEEIQSIFESIPWEDLKQNYVYFKGTVRLYRGKVNIIPESVSDISLKPIFLKEK